MGVFKVTVDLTELFTIENLLGIINIGGVKRKLKLPWELRLFIF